MGFLRWLNDLFTVRKPLYEKHYLDHPNTHSAKCYCGAGKIRIKKGSSVPPAFNLIGTKRQVKNCNQKGYVHLRAEFPQGWVICKVCGWRNPRDD